MKKVIGKFERLYPNPVVLATSSSEGIDNVLTLAWVGTVCSDPKLISISVRPTRYSHGLIKSSREFAINIPTSELIYACNFCGMNSGKDIDKFKKLDLTRVKASEISSPLIKECPINIECRVMQVIDLGVHDLFIGEVLCVNCDEELIYEDGDIDYERMDIISYCMGKYYSNKLI